MIQSMSKGAQGQEEEKRKQRLLTALPKVTYSFVPHSDSVF